MTVVPPEIKPPGLIMEELYNELRAHGAKKAALKWEIDPY